MGPTATIGILNVGSGDVKLTFDKNNPSEMIRSSRIVKDMLRRGFALLVEEPPGSGQYTRAHDLREDTSEYIIADGPEIASAPITPEVRLDEPSTADAAATTPRKTNRKSVHASTTSGIAVARSAGG